GRGPSRCRGRWNCRGRRACAPAPRPSAAGGYVHRCSFRALTDIHKVTHLLDHATDGGGIGVLDRLVEPPKPEPPDGVFLVLAIADRALAIRDAERGHAMPPLARRRSDTRERPWGRAARRGLRSS